MKDGYPGRSAIRISKGEGFTNRIHEQSSERIHILIDIQTDRHTPNHRD